MAIQGIPSTTTTSSGGTKMRALPARSRTDRAPALAAETPGSASELEERRVERLRPEIGPQDVAGVELRVGGLPDEEVRQSLLAAGSDHEVRIWLARRVESARDRGLIDLVGGDPTRCQTAKGVHELGAAGVVEGDVQRQPGAGRGLGEGALDGRAGVGGQFREAAQNVDADALLDEPVGLPAHRRLQQGEQAAHLLVRASPVLPAERVQGQVGDAAPDRVTEYVADGFDARGVALELRQAALPCPAPVAVHDDRDMGRKL